jgi:hypothetical protein
MPGTTLFVFSLLSLACVGALAQELEPRSHSGGPDNINFIATGFSSSSGDMLFDASLPVSDVKAKIDAFSVVYGGSAPVLGHTGNFALAIPYLWGDVRGEVGEQTASASRVGLGDMRLRLAIDLVGDIPVTASEYAKRRQRPRVDASLVIIAPTGQYDPAKLINIGTNRWSFKPEIGVSLPCGRWLLETSLAVWIYTDNDDFFGGVRRAQEPIGSLQAHLSYVFRPGLWLAAGATYYRGGRTTAGEIENNDVQGNSRVGLALGVPISNSQSIRFIWSSGVSTRFGGDFDTWGVLWTYAWRRR